MEKVINNQMISIIIPLYNKEKCILKTIQSVINQTYPDFELIIVNDGSTDNSVNVVKEYVSRLETEDRKVRIISKENGGVCSARNRGILEAKSEYIALLDGDDLWDKEYLAEQVKMIRDFPKADMWGMNFAETDNGVITQTYETGLPEGYRGYVENYFEIPGRVSDLCHPSSVIIRKTTFDKVGLFDERIKYSEDSDMWFRINALCITAFNDKILVLYKQDAENRAMNRTRHLKDWLPYYVDKYKEPVYKGNIVFYQWVNRWCAVRIRQCFFSKDKKERQDAQVASKKLDYAVIPFKYWLFFHLPYNWAKIFNDIDYIRMKRK